MFPITHVTQTWSSKIPLAAPLIVSHMTPDVPKISFRLALVLPLHLRHDRGFCKLILRNMGNSSCGIDTIFEGHWQLILTFSGTIRLVS